MAAPLDRRDLDHVLNHTRELWEVTRNQAVFISGGTGFVGTWLLETILWANDVLGLDTRVTVLTRNADRFRQRSPHIALHRAVTLLEGSVAQVSLAVERCAFVIHAATESPHAPSTSSPLGAFDADVNGTRRMLEYAVACGAKRFLFTSSGAVYGRQPPDLRNIPEEYVGAPAPEDAEAAYAHAKRISEFMCSTYGLVHGLHTGIARLFAFIGPVLPLDANYAAGNFIRDSLRGGPIKISGDGTPYRSYLYASDLAIWLWTILFRGAPGRTYNVGSPDPIAIVDLARLVGPECDILIAHQPVGGALPSRYVPSTNRAARELGLRTWISLPDAIERTKRWGAKNARSGMDGKAAQLALGSASSGAA